ncbi:MAG: class I SAM-dependent methyltransferase [Fusicatenibacter sp.]|nr:class I SAM-dependent methyltransferase [Lachnospiraceae bacterium]MDY2937940.1 class I SAM-dependent methyltransferase [Fusicatenibacter sp.]
MEREESYTSFAQVYDMFMDNVDYPAWSEYLLGLLREYGIEDGLVLDLGCGTGNMTELLSKAGYDMIGVDNSEDMLEIAGEKRAASGLDILYLLQDMREFELYGTVRAVISICDSMNYILEEEELCRVFSLVNNYLDPGGYFIFDLNTKYKYEQMGETTIAENREEASFIWDNYYDPQEEINEYELAIFLPVGEDLYRKFEEVHYQRAYDLPTIRYLLEEAGMEYVTAYDAFTRNAPSDTSERIYVIAREKGKKEEKGTADPCRLR